MPTCKPEYLVQFAIMGHAYGRVMFGLAQPKIGIISNGEEEDKGSMLVRETYPLLEGERSEFCRQRRGQGHRQGVSQRRGDHGLTGNVIVELGTEGVVSFLGKTLKSQFTGGLRNKIALALMIPGLILMIPGLALLYPSVVALRKRVDWREIGGAPLLGVNGVVIIGHGRSDVKAIQSMIRMAEKAHSRIWSTSFGTSLAAQGMER